MREDGESENFLLRRTSRNLFEQTSAVHREGEGRGGREGGNRPDSDFEVPAKIIIIS
jgi:hypothetical protein